MKLLFFAAIVFVSCNNAGTETTDTTKDSTGSSKDSTMAAPAVAMNYPYTIDHPDNWDMGSTANTMVALSALK
ncbi:MAG: hypothetical protein ACRDE5_17665, partial [Ginsengibacter sp.]